MWLKGPPPAQDNQMAEPDMASQDERNKEQVQTTGAAQAGDLAPKKLPAGTRTWSTVAETAAHFHLGEWFIRKTANEMALRGVEGHPILAGGKWLIDIDAMTDYFSTNAEKAAAESRYPMSEPDGSVTPVRDDENWGWS
jgi:hypothetical protein